MALTKVTDTLDAHQSLGSQPNSDDGISATDLKLRYDRDVNRLKTFINDTLTAEIDTDFATKEEVAGIILGQITDGSLTDVKLSDDPTDIKARVNDIINDNNKLKAELERNSYDDYQLWLELYYQGVISQVEAENAKAIIFDGFMDISNVDTTNSTVTIDTTSKKVTLKNVDILLKTGNSGVGLQGNNRLAQTFTMEGDANLKTITIPMNNTVSATVKLRIVNTDTYGVPMISSIVCEDIEFAVNSTIDSYEIDIGALPLTDGVKYAVVFSTTYSIQDSVRFYYGGTYEEGISYYSNDSGNTWNNNNSSMRLDFAFDYISPSTLISDAKAIPFTPTTLKLYQSVKKPVGTSITTTLSADGGTNYETPTLTTSRVDPKFPDYTEEEYDLTIANAGQEIVLKSVLAGANRDEVEIKRYGLIIS